MRTALLIIATGKKYWDYAEQLIDSAKQYFPYHESILWTDCNDRLGADFRFPKKALGFPNETMYRYHTFLEYKKQLEAYKNLYFCDADMLMVSKIKEEEITANGIVAVFHPGFINSCGTPERRPESFSAIPHDAKNQYFCGGFQGGSSEAYLMMAEELAWRIDQDVNRGIIPIWHDESAMNRYLYERHPAKILGPEFCYPDVKGEYYRDKWRAAGLGEIKPKILALEKPR